MHSRLYESLFGCIVFNFDLRRFSISNGLCIGMMCLTPCILNDEHEHFCLCASLCICCMRVCVAWGPRAASKIYTHCYFEWINVIPKTTAYTICCLINVSWIHLCFGKENACILHDIFAFIQNIHFVQELHSNPSDGNRKMAL